ncbi:MAG TPA: ABC transporter permease [Acidimicrobiia bacterium]|nr:ABC transporter permease [Acidimicrobiia bacterium]
MTSSSLVGELRKLPAFVRRDFLTAWSYRTAFFGDVINLSTQIIMFYFVGLMVDPDVIPRFGGREVGYIGFVSVGIALGAFLQLGMGQVSTAIRREQLMGTLESLFMTPTSTTTLQVGLAVYDLVYVPVRTALFLTAVAMIFNLQIVPSGILPATVVLLLFIPFVWGIGMISGAAVLTFRRGGSMLSVVGFGLNITSGAYFPLDLFPGWVQRLAEVNPVAIAFSATRETLLGGAGWDSVAPHVAPLALFAIGALTLGAIATRLALSRERRQGTLGLY